MTKVTLTNGKPRTCVDLEGLLGLKRGDVLNINTENGQIADINFAESVTVNAALKKKIEDLVGLKAK